MDLPLLFSNRSHVGTVREENEDYLGYFRVRDRHVFLLADGMGGAVAGALASRTAVEEAEAALRLDPAGEPASLLAAAVEAANSTCLELQQGRLELQGLGTTLDIVVIEGPRSWWAHIGDGRIYHIHGFWSRQLTRDHSVVQRMVDDGLLDPAEAGGHPQRHVLCRAIGRAEHVEPDLSPEPLELADGDSLVLCTDGLSDLVSAREIGRMVEAAGPEASCERLVDLALARGGADNVTVQVVHRGWPRRSWRHRTSVCRAEQAPS